MKPSDQIVKIAEEMVSKEYMHRNHGMSWPQFLNAEKNNVAWIIDAILEYLDKSSERSQSNT